MKKKSFYKRSCLMLLVAALISCSTNNEADLIGVWQTDSITTVVNGFSHTNNIFDEHWSQFDYQDDGKVFERRKKEFRAYVYSVSQPDSLFYRDTTGMLVGQYKILSLDKEQLVLRKEQKPYLPGANQNLFEIRYFSKMNTPAVQP